MGTLTFDELCRRAGGRRRYNAQRGRDAMIRRRKLLALLGEVGLTQRAMARKLEVSPATITRDMQLLTRLDLVKWARAAPAMAAAGKMTRIRLFQRGRRAMATVTIE